MKVIKILMSGGAVALINPSFRYCVKLFFEAVAENEKYLKKVLEEDSFVSITAFGAEIESAYKLTAKDISEIENIVYNKIGEKDAKELVGYEKDGKTPVCEKREYEIIDSVEIPQSRNYRDAWKSENGKINIDLEKAKAAHKALIGIKARERVPFDAFGNQDLSAVMDEAKALEIEKAKNLTELYNKWPDSINNRLSDREYEVFKK